MIKANELRIGNKFQALRIPGKPADILTVKYFTEGIFPDMAIIFEEGGYMGSQVGNYVPMVPSSAANGIPLTQEILEKCGFELFPWGWVKKSTKDFGIRLQVKSFSYEVSGNNPVPLQYLHQLQNLYFALTGEELEIKP